MHDWDIRYGEDAEVCVSSEGVEGIMTFLPSTSAPPFRRPARTRPSMAASCSARPIPIASGRLPSPARRRKIPPTFSGAHDATITADGEAHLLLLYGRAKRGEAEASGRLTIEGNTELANELLCVLYANY